jgi:hypothetical protein
MPTWPAANLSSSGLSLGNFQGQTLGRFFALIIRLAEGQSCFESSNVQVQPRSCHDIEKDVTGFVNELVELFPAVRDDQRILCKTEVCAVEEDQDLALLKDIACEDDKLLEVAVDKEMAVRGHTVTHWKADGNSKMWAGDDNFGVESKSHHFGEFSISAKSPDWRSKHQHKYRSV